MPEIPALQDSAAAIAIATTYGESSLYGPAGESDLAALLQVLRPVVGQVIETYHHNLVGLAKYRRLLKAMSADELADLKRQQAANIVNLLAPGLTAHRHERMAREIGRRQVLSCVSKEELAFSKDLLFSAVCSHIDRALHARALALLSARMMRDLAWQLTEFQDVHAQRTRLLLNITRLSWESSSYTDLIAQVAELLANHPGICACFVGRADSRSALFSYEVLAGAQMEPYLTRVQEIRSAYVNAGTVWPGRAAVDKAWQSKRIEYSINIATDPEMPPWRDVALAHGFRSVVAVPLVCQPDAAPTAILGLYSDYSGGFSSDDQIAFLEQLQSLLTYAIVRLAALEGVSYMIPHGVRRRWSALLKTDALCMVYQPLLDLKTRSVKKIEALARLRDEGRLLSPGEFFPALTSEDFFVLYAQGLHQALRQRAIWRQSGMDLSISVNMPVDALGDIRYYNATAQALQEHDCPASMLTLEILETDEMPGGVDVATELERYKALGVDLAEDDLGSGHSSLMRLRELPFDSVKIDRSLVMLNGENSADVLHFIYQLTRLGHSLGKSVVVEGVEDNDLLEAVTILGADAIQGYVLTRPLLADEITTWLADHQVYPALVYTQSVLAQMARLLIWEECFYLLRDETTATGGIADINTSVLPFDTIDAGIQRVFVLTAVNQGPGSPEYRQAREQLMQALITRTMQ